MRCAYVHVHVHVHVHMHVHVHVHVQELRKLQATRYRLQVTSSEHEFAANTTAARLHASPATP